MQTVPKALSIAGSDSGGGAGIQADLKTMSALGVYGCSVITALTAQNTRGVTGVHEVPSGFVKAQLDAVLSDIDVDSIKIGMLFAPAIVDVVADTLEHCGIRSVVLDPVMVAKSGDRLLRPEAVAALRERLLPRAFVLTPNLPEAGDLLDGPTPQSRREMEEAARALLERGPRWVLLKGGHLADPDLSSDLLMSEGVTLWLDGVRRDSPNTHGTGCTLSAAIASELARGQPVESAVRRSKEYLSTALDYANHLGVGRGQGPVHHFHQHWGKGSP